MRFRCQLVCMQGLQWYALAREVIIYGRGPTKEAALASLCEQLQDAVTRQTLDEQRHTPCWLAGYDLAMHAGAECLVTEFTHAQSRPLPHDPGAGG